MAEVLIKKETKMMQKRMCIDRFRIGFALVLFLAIVNTDLKSLNFY